MQQSQIGYRRVVRALRKMKEAAQASAGTIEISDHCPECEAVIKFNFFNISGRQTAYSNCQNCKENIRLVKTFKPHK